MLAPMTVPRIGTRGRHHGERASVAALGLPSDGTHSIVQLSFPRKYFACMKNQNNGIIADRHGLDINPQDEVK